MRSPNATRIKCLFNKYEKAYTMDILDSFLLPSVRTQWVELFQKISRVIEYDNLSIFQALSGPCPPGHPEARVQQCAQFDGNNFSNPRLPATVKWFPDYKKGDVS